MLNHFVAVYLIVLQVMVMENSERIDLVMDDYGERQNACVMHSDMEQSKNDR